VRVVGVQVELAEPLALAHDLYHGVDGYELALVLGPFALLYFLIQALSSRFYVHLLQLLAHNPLFLLH